MTAGYLGRRRDEKRGEVREVVAWGRGRKGRGARAGRERIRRKHKENKKEAQRPRR